MCVSAFSPSSNMVMDMETFGRNPTAECYWLSFHKHSLMFQIQKICKDTFASASCEMNASHWKKKQKLYRNYILIIYGLGFSKIHQSLIWKHIGVQPYSFVVYLKVSTNSETPLVLCQDCKHLIDSCVYKKLLSVSRHWRLGLVKWMVHRKNINNEL